MVSSGRPAWTSLSKPVWMSPLITSRRAASAAPCLPDMPIHAVGLYGGESRRHALTAASQADWKLASSVSYGRRLPSWFVVKVRLLWRKLALPGENASIPSLHEHAQSPRVSGQLSCRDPGASPRLPIIRREWRNRIVESHISRRLSRCEGHGARQAASGGIDCPERRIVPFSSRLLDDPSDLGDLVVPAAQLSDLDDVAGLRCLDDESFAEVHADVAWVGRGAVAAGDQDEVAG